MTNEEAAVWFEARLKNIAMPGAREMHKMAVSALRAREKEPCPFCGGDRDCMMEAFMDGFAKIIEAAGHYALSVEDNDATTSLIFNINNCPICGRKLPEPPEVKDGHH